MSKGYGVRPSSILNIEDGLAAYQLDKAVHALGSRVEVALQKNDKKKRPIPAEDVLRRLLTKKEAPSAYGILERRATKTIKIKPGQDITEVL